MSSAVVDPPTAPVRASTRAAEPSAELFRLGALPPATILVVANSDSWQRLMCAVDEEGPDARLSPDEIYPVPRSSWLRVLQPGPTRTRVRIVEGPYAGRFGWVIPEAVMPDSGAGSAESR